jgi:peptidyl-prolyl cis-trans isomerase D
MPRFSVRGCRPGARLAPDPQEISSMLQKIRDKVSGWIAGVFLGAIAVVFVFWGINFENSANTYAAKVNGEKISVEAMTRAWQQRQSQLQQMMRGELPEAMVKAQQKNIMDEFVRRTLLKQRASELGYRVSDAALAEQIVSFPELQVDGKFSRDRYAALLRQQGRTEPQFEAELRGDLAIGQIQGGIVDSAFVTPYELERRLVLEKQEREVDYALIASNSFASQIVVTDEQIQAWYDSHKNDYLLPETVDLQYVELTRARAESGVTVTEEGLKDYYSQVKERFESPERRKARHILITVGDGVDDAAAKKQAEELAAKAKAGADFSQLAKENSKDPGSAQQGGDLGWAQRGTMVGPFEEALFAMQKDEIRGPIKTQFGYHVIRLDDIEAAGLRSYEDVRTELEAEFRRDRSQTIFYDESQKLADRAFSSLTELDSVAKEFNLPVKTVPGFTREGGGELGAEPTVIEAAFSEDVLERGQNSALVTIGEDRAVVLRVANHKPAEPRPLAEVRSQIETQLRTNAAREAAQKKGAEVLAKLQEGGAWSEVAAQAGLTPVGKRFIGRKDAVVPASVTSTAFAPTPAQVSESKPHYANVATDDGNYAVVMVTNVRSGNAATESAEEKTQRRRVAERQMGNEEFMAYIAELEREADVVRNEKVFQQ